MIKKVKLGDVADLSIGFVGTVTTQYEEGGVPFFRTLNIKPYQIVDDDLKRITKEFHESQKKSQLFCGDIAMVHTGVPGICCVIPQEYDDSNCIDMIVIKPHKDAVDANYLSAYMNTIGYKHIERQQVGCIQKHFNLKDAVELEIYLPELNKQIKIGQFVDIINKKIEKNQSIISELEKIATTIFDYWFLQFEYPNEEGMPYKSSGGQMVRDNILNRDVPFGWNVKEISELCEFNNGINYEKDEKGDKEYKIVNVRNITSSSLLIDDADLDSIVLDSKKAEKYVITADDILIARSGNPGAVRLLEADCEKTIFCGFIIRCKPLDSSLRYYITYSLKKMEGTSATKTGGSILQNVSQDTLKSIKVIVPPQVVVNRFNTEIGVIINRMQKVIEENQNLMSLREYIVPMLLNGQIEF